ncbi:MAG: hypothetical protein LW835_06625 [Burkholderiaceae bacterium]|jgi:hypothetical protein|nr:hypothetical protein [Burkholderiales bacterium]MCE2644887.1 hypothetical protein [Burkholderiaceae bacterium]
MGRFAGDGARRRDADAMRSRRVRLTGHPCSELTAGKLAKERLHGQSTAVLPGGRKQINTTI